MIPKTQPEVSPVNLKDASLPAQASSLLLGLALLTFEFRGTAGEGKALGSGSGSTPIAALKVGEPLSESAVRPPLHLAGLKHEAIPASPEKGMFPNETRCQTVFRGEGDSYKLVIPKAVGMVAITPTTISHLAYMHVTIDPNEFGSSFFTNVSALVPGSVKLGQDAARFKSKQNPAGNFYDIAFANLSGDQLSMSIPADASYSIAISKEDRNGVKRGCLEVEFHYQENGKKAKTVLTALVPDGRVLTKIAEISVQHSGRAVEKSNASIKLTSVNAITALSENLDPTDVLAKAAPREVASATIPAVGRQD